MPCPSHVDYIVDRCKARLNLTRCLSGSIFSAEQEHFSSCTKRSYASWSIRILWHTPRRQILLNKISMSLQIRCGSMTGCARASLQVECDQPPLALRRRCLQVDYAIKLFSARSYGRLLADCWQNHHIYQPDREPFYNKVRAVLDVAGINGVPARPPAPPAPRIAVINLDPNRHLSTTCKRMLIV